MTIEEQASESCVIESVQDFSFWFPRRALFPQSDTFTVERSEW